MLRRSQFKTARWMTGLVVGSAAGCMLTSPLDELPGAPTPDQSEGGSSGSSSTAGAPSGGTGSLSDAGAGGAPPIPEGECNTNADCLLGSGEVPYRCRPSDKTCQMLKTSECPVVEGNYADPNALFFGSFANLSTLTPKNNDILRAQLLALDDFSGQSEGGLPDAAGGPRRPLVLVVCDNSQKAAAEGLRHLVEDLEVPAVLATLKPGDLRAGFDKYKTREVLFLSPVTLTKTLVDEPDQDLIWNLLGQPADFDPAYRALLHHMETHVRTSVLGTPQQPYAPDIRVALVTTGDAFDSDLENLIAPNLTYNNKTIVQNGEASYLGIQVSEDADLQELATQIVLFQPHIVVSMASGVMTSMGGLINKIEDDWELAPNFGPLPRYLLSPYNSGDLGYVLKRLEENYQVLEEDDPQDRFVGISIASAADTSLQNAYAVRLGNKFPNAYSDTANYYDAFYFLSYATYAADPAAPLTGSSIARGMRRLLSGDSFDPVPTQMSDVFAALADPETTIRLESTLGPPGFNEATGSRSVQASLLCFNRVASNFVLERDVRRYDADLGEFVGDEPFCSSNIVPP